IDPLTVLAPPPGGSAPGVEVGATGEELAQPRALLAEENIPHQVEFQHFLARVAAQLETRLIDPDDAAEPIRDQLGSTRIEGHRGDALFLAPPVGFADVVECQHSALPPTVGGTIRGCGICDLVLVPMARDDRRVS